VGAVRVLVLGRAGRCLVRLVTVVMIMAVGLLVGMRVLVCVDMTRAGPVIMARADGQQPDRPT
jgi:hypothetical protein